MRHRAGHWATKLKRWTNRLASRVCAFLSPTSVILRANLICLTAKFSVCFLMWRECTVVISTTFRGAWTNGTSAKPNGQNRGFGSRPHRFFANRRSPFRPRLGNAYRTSEGKQAAPILTSFRKKKTGTEFSEKPFETTE